MKPSPLPSTISTGETGTMSWKENMANPFTINIAKYPSQVCAPFSNCLNTIDTTTANLRLTGMSEQQADADVVMKMQELEGNSMNDMSIVIQFLPGLLYPGSPTPYANGRDAVTPHLGAFCYIQADGICRAVNILRADKLETLADGVKQCRLLKAGMKVSLMQPAKITGGWGYFHRGADSMLRISGPVPGSGAPNQRPVGDNVQPVQIGQPAYVRDLSGMWYLATKEELLRVTRQFAGVIPYKLDEHEHVTMVSRPFDVVRATEYLPLVHEDLLHELRPEHYGRLLNGLTDPGWSPGFMLLQPTFYTTLAPDAVPPNLCIETYTGWEVLPFAGTFAHYLRTPARQAKNWNDGQSPPEHKMNDFFGRLQAGLDIIDRYSGTVTAAYGMGRKFAAAL